MSEESPLFPLQPQELISESKSLLKSGLPISLMLLADLIAAVISFHFAGKHGNAAQQDIVSSYFWVYTTFVLIFLTSIDHGFTIFASKLFGAKKYKELGMLYQKNLFAVAHPLITVILLMALFAITSEGDERVFLLSVIPSVIAAALFRSTNYFLFSQNIFNAPAIIILALIPTYVFLCYISVSILNMGVVGISLVKSITDIVAVIILFSYIRFTGVCRDTWIPWTKESLKNKEEYLKRTSRLGAGSSLEFFIYQLSFLMQFLGDWGFDEVFKIALFLAYALFCIPWGLSLSMQAKFGNAIGEGRNVKVQKIMAGGIALNALFSLITVIFIVSLKKQIASLFFTNEDAESLEKMLLIYAAAFCFKSYAYIIGGLLRVIGKEKQEINSFLVSILCIPLRWILESYGYGLIGVWLCFAVGEFLRFTWIIYQVCVLNWREQIEEAKRTFDEESSVETQSLIEFTERA